MANVLVIDDDPVVRRTVTRILRSSGHETVEAVDGRKGIEAMGLQHMDLVITDLFMPRQEGIETIREIRKISALPIIAMSGGATTQGTPLVDPFDPLIAAQQLGANMSIRKPFTGDALIAAVDEMLRTVPHASDPQSPHRNRGA